MVYVSSDDKCPAAREHAAHESPRDEEIYSPRRGFITQGCRRPCALGLAQAHRWRGPTGGLPGAQGLEVAAGCSHLESRPQAPLSAPGQLPWLPVGPHRRSGVEGTCQSLGGGNPLPAATHFSRLSVKMGGLVSSREMEGRAPALHR